MRRGQMVTGYREGDNSGPMRKHDRVTGANALGWERKNHYDTDYPKWYGHCHAWAAAAVSEVEPVRPVRYEGETFYVGDMKALLTEAHYGDKATVFGERNTGGNADPQDIYPDALWKLLQDYVGEQGLPILIDSEASKEVWTYPLYAYTVDFEKARGSDNLYECEMTVFLADLKVSPDFVGTLPLRKTYTFTVRMKDGVIEEGSGRWTGESRTKHPDYAWYPASRGQENEDLVYSLAQRLAEMSNGGSTSSSNLPAALAAREEWDRANGTEHARNRPEAPVADEHGGVLVSNPALPDLSVRRRREPAGRVARRETERGAAPAAARGAWRVERGALGSARTG